MAPLPATLSADLATWASLDLRPRPYRHKHPRLSEAEIVLRWLCSHYPITDWKDIRPSAVQNFIRSHEHLKPATLQSYLKGLRKWLRWHERDDIHAPILSARLTELAPPTITNDPFAVDDDTWSRLLHRARWVFAGSNALTISTRTGRKAATMKHWRPGAFYLWLQLGAHLGFRPWELAYLTTGELQLDAPVPHVALVNHEARAQKTPLAGTRLALTAELVTELRVYVTSLDTPFLFAVPNPRWPSGWQPPHYDQIWRALREETGLPLNGRIVRRRHATRTAAANPNMFEVIRATRHARIDTLVKHYVQRHGGRVVDPTTGKLMDNG